MTGTLRLCVVAASFCLGLASPGTQADGNSATSIRFVNRTGKFRDADCSWSLDHGATWHSFADHPTAACPNGNGRVYVCVGRRPRNFDDRGTPWDFVEWAHTNSTWSGNTTQVDAFALPITLEMNGMRVGLAKSRSELFKAFREGAPREFRACAESDTFILSPCRAGFGKGGPNERYFDQYINEVWSRYSVRKLTPSGRWVGEVVNGALIYTPAENGKPLVGGQPLRCESKPSTQDAFLGTGVLAANPRFCAAINRHVLADPADWLNPATYYQTLPYNWYARFFHEQAIDRKAYGFCYDDVADQAAYFSAKGSELTITLRW